MPRCAALIPYSTLAHKHNVIYWKLWDVVYSECQPRCQVPGNEVD